MGFDLVKEFGSSSSSSRPSIKRGGGGGGGSGMSGYCVRPSCRKKITIENHKIQTVNTRGGTRHMAKGTCSSCGKSVTKFVKG